MPFYYLIIYLLFLFTACSQSQDNNSLSDDPVLIIKDYPIEIRNIAIDSLRKRCSEIDTSLVLLEVSFPNSNYTALDKKGNTIESRKTYGKNFYHVILKYFSSNCNKMLFLIMNVSTYQVVFFKEIQATR